jgi:hypothetical protein
LKIAHQAQEISTKHCNYCNPIANLFWKMVCWLLEQHLGQRKCGRDSRFDSVEWTNSGFRRETQRNFYIFYRNVSPSVVKLSNTNLVYMEPQVEKFELGNLLHL